MKYIVYVLICFLCLCNMPVLYGQLISDINLETFVVDNNEQFPIHYITVSATYNLPSSDYKVEMIMEPDTQFTHVLVPNSNGSGVIKELQTTNFVPKYRYTHVAWPKINTNSDVVFNINKKLPVKITPLSNNNNVAILSNISYTIIPENIGIFEIDSIDDNVDGYIVPNSIGEGTLTVSGFNKNQEIVSNLLNFTVTNQQSLTQSTVLTYRICAIPYSVFHKGYAPNDSRFSVTGQLSLTSYIWVAKIYNKNTKELVDEKSFILNVSTN